MVDGEQFDRDVKAAEHALKELERAAGADRQKLQAEQAALQKELETKQAERGQLVRRAFPKTCWPPTSASPRAITESASPRF